ncbi:hypothetical protein M569_15358, partial [Genlisea aurea]
MVIRLVMRVALLVLVVVTISLREVATGVQSYQPPESSPLAECPLDLIHGYDAYLPKQNFRRIFPPLWTPAALHKLDKNLTMAVLTYLIGRKLLPMPDPRILCVGEGSSSAVLALRRLGLSESVSVDGGPSFSALEKRYVYELGFEDRLFDFVFSRNLHRGPLPDLFVREIERVLIPGGIGAMLVPARSLQSGDMIGSALTFASFLESSDIVHSCGVGPYTLIVFEKRAEKFASFEYLQLPGDCPSIATNKPFMNYIEPLASPGELTYLPRFVNVSSRNKLIYINIGAGEYARPTIENISKLYYPSDRSMTFDKFVVHYISSITDTYIPEPGINLVFYQPPGEEFDPPEIVSLDQLDEFMDEDDFDLISWIKETASGGNFVVLLMNAEETELNILEELYKSGAICYLDEVFLRCPPEKPHCGKTLTSLRRSGLYVH